MMAFPANELESALAALRAGAGSPDHLLQALADNELWVPLPGGTGDGGEAPLPVMLLDGQPYVAVYTSAEQYAQGAGQQAHMVIGGRALAGMLDERLGLAVNPGCDVGLPVRSDGVRSMRGGRTTARTGRSVRLGAPAEEPTALLTALARTFERVPAVIEARRALAQVGEQPPGLLIGIRADQRVAGWRQAALAAVDAAASAEPMRLSVDTVFLDSPTEPITAWMLGNTEPFYQRNAEPPR